MIRTAAASEVIDLRHKVLRAGLPRETAMFPGDDAPTARHFVAEVDGRIIGCVTLHLNEWNGERAWQLRGMAIEPTRQGSGIGAQLLCEAERSAAASEVKQMWCNARVPASGFYTKHGWTTESDEFDIPTAGPHIRMSKRVE